MTGVVGRAVRHRYIRTGVCLLFCLQGDSTSSMVSGSTCQILAGPGQDTKKGCLRTAFFVFRINTPRKVNEKHLYFGIIALKGVVTWVIFMIILYHMIRSKCHPIARNHTCVLCFSLCLSIFLQRFNSFVLDNTGMKYCFTNQTIHKTAIIDIWYYSVGTSTAECTQ